MKTVLRVAKVVSTDTSKIMGPENQGTRRQEVTRTQGCTESVGGRKWSTVGD